MPRETWHEAPVGIYLDWNATSPPHSDVLRVMRETAERTWANPSSVHAAGRAARRIVEDVRESLGRALSRSPRDILFTGGGTEANHLALEGARWLVTSRIEHASIVAQSERLRERGAQVEYAQVSPDGVVTPDAVDRALHLVLGGAPRDRRSAEQGGLKNENTPLVAVMAANHETGVIQPLADIRAVCERWGARLHVDAVQWLGRRDPEALLVADSVAIAGHKLRGPKGVGALLFDCGFVPVPLGRGGAQERGMRPGTIDASAISGLGAALARREDSERGYARAAQLGRELVAQVERHAAQPVRLHGQGAARLEHCVNLGFAEWKGDELVAALDLLGVCVSSGSACSAGTAEPSAVVEAMLGREQASRAVRISFGEDSTEQDLARLLHGLNQLEILRM